ncbi:hypothetical protein D3C81_2229120 [compost metagenome]
MARVAASNRTSAEVCASSLARRVIRRLRSKGIGLFFVIRRSLVSIISTETQRPYGDSPG